MDVSNGACCCSSSASVPLSGLRVLIVDDDPDTIVLFALTFEQEGAVVLTATSVAEALFAIEHHQPHVLLSDIQMAGQDGHTLIRKVRSQEVDGRAKLSAIAITACAQAADHEQAIAAGFDRFLTKPVDLETLVAAVSELTAFSYQSIGTVY